MNTSRFTVLTALLLLAMYTEAAASLKFDQTSLFVPSEAAAKSITGDFKFTNTGSSTIEIIETKTSCGCTIAKTNKRLYAPGESDIIKAIFTLGDREGPQKKNILVRTNESGVNEYILSLETNIPIQMTIEPRHLIWTHEERQTAKSIAIKYTTPGQLKLLEARDPLGNFQAKLSASTDTMDVQVLVTPAPNAIQGHLLLQFATENGGKVEKTVLLRVLPDPAVIDRFRKPIASPDKKES